MGRGTGLSQLEQYVLLCLIRLGDEAYGVAIHASGSPSSPTGTTQMSLPPAPVGLTAIQRPSGDHEVGNGAGSSSGSRSCSA